MIIGITGLAGAGKGVVVDYLVEHHGFAHYSIRNFLAVELSKRGMPVSRETLGRMGDELREEHGPLAKLMLKDVEPGEDIILESVRSLMEANYIKEHGGKLWAVEADVTTRFKRIETRGSVVDDLSLEQFLAVEKSESNNPEPYKMNMIEVAKMADVTLQNNGTREELYAQIENALV